MLLNGLQLFSQFTVAFSSFKQAFIHFDASVSFICCQLCTLFTMGTCILNMILTLQKRKLIHSFMLQKLAWTFRYYFFWHFVIDWKENNKNRSLFKHLYWCIQNTQMFYLYFVMAFFFHIFFSNRGDGYCSCT